MTDGSWFRERVDAELGATPPVPEDRLPSVLERATGVARRRLAELAAAGAVVLVSLGLVVVTVLVSKGGPARTGPDQGGGVPGAPVVVPAPAGETAPATVAQRTAAQSAAGNTTPGGQGSSQTGYYRQGPGQASTTGSSAGTSTGPAGGPTSRPGPPTTTAGHPTTSAPATTSAPPTTTSAPPTTTSATTTGPTTAPAGGPTTGPETGPSST
jgi:hypothetical protein